MNVTFPVKCIDTGEVCPNYYEYLKSQHWQNLRKKYYESGLFKRNVYFPNACECCGLGGSFDLHHRTYKRIGNENLDDLVAVCRNCHEKLHKIEKEKVHNIWTAPDILRKKLNKKFRKKKSKPAFVRRIETKQREKAKKFKKLGKLLKNSQIEQPKRYVKRPPSQYTNNTGQKLTYDGKGFYYR